MSKMKRKERISRLIDTAELLSFSMIIAIAIVAKSILMHKKGAARRNSKKH